MPRPRKDPPELLDGGARLVFESNRPIAHVARDLGGRRPDLPTSEKREEIKPLREEVDELRRANEILKAASAFFATELDTDRPQDLGAASGPMACSPGRRPRSCARCGGAS